MKVAGFQYFCIETHVVYKMLLTPCPDTLLTCAFLFSLLGCFTKLSSSNTAPVFSNLRPDNSTVRTIYEDIQKGSTVLILTATDADNDSYYFLLVGQSKHKFVLQNAILQTNDSFDYEDPADRSHTVVLRVSDGSNHTDCILNVGVVNVFDEVPQISGPLQAAIEEEQPVGTVVDGLFNVTDRDAGDVLTYSLSGRDRNSFAFDTTMKKVTIARRLDRDSGGITVFNNLLLTVRDSAGNTATAGLTVSLVDINDNAPVCVPSFGHATVPENSPDGSHVHTLSCRDDDGGANGNYFLSISNSSFSRYFRLRGSSEVVTTAAPLDYEGLSSANHRSELTILAIDRPVSGVSALTGTAVVSVTVTPMNEHSPAWGNFSPPYTAGTPFDVKESNPVGTVVLTIRATDSDGGSDGDITYEAGPIGNGTTVFRVDAVSGNVEVNNQLDCDLATNGGEFYVLEVQAKDGGGLKTGYRKLLFRILDVNDNPPVFGQTSYEVVTREDAAVGSRLVLLTARDNDQTANLTYSLLSGGKNKFEFQATSPGLMVIKEAIDPDLTKRDDLFYSLVVVVKDGGRPRELSATATVHVTVDTVNDHSPAFTQTTPLRKSEDTPLGTLITRVTATDEDCGDDGKLLYAVVGGNLQNHFLIDSKSGAITLVKELDYETRNNRFINLIIEAKDSGIPFKTAKTTVNITVVDVNDNVPSCVAPALQISIKENITVGCLVSSVLCTDPDETDSLSFTFCSQNRFTEFAINSTGAITVVQALDYDSGPRSYVTDVCVTDGTKTASVMLSIRLIPVNEHSPKFSAPYQNFSFPESASVGTGVPYTTADDADAAPHGIVRYTYASAQSGTSYFHIVPSSGKIYLSRSLDYESLPPGKKFYTLTVRAIDGGNLEDSTTLKIEVTDVNDNNPICSPSAYTQSIAENQGASQLIASLGCSDADSGSAGNLTYSLQQVPPGRDFHVTTSGAVFVNSSLDYEVHEFYTLEVRAKDGGGNSAVVLVSVHVLDVNEGPPVFARNYSESVFENKPVGTLIARVAASDPDGSGTPNGRLIYTVVDGNSASKFIIDPNSGRVTLSSFLDSEAQRLYLLKIRVSAAIGGRSATTFLNVTVLNVNDNYPACTEMTFHRSVSENSTAGYTVLSLVCKDEDGDKLGYFMTGGDTSKFEMLNTSLKLKGRLDFESSPRTYDLTIEVTDSLNSVYIHGTVTVGAVNEHSPLFTNGGIYKQSIQEDHPTGDTVLRVTANDKDSTDTAHGQVVYAFAVYQRVFRIDGRTGVIRLASELDREKKMSYDFNVSATDRLYTATASVVITVTDVNDNPPIFNPVNYWASVSETDPAGASVARVTATDADDPNTNNNGVITFTIVGGDAKVAFQIDPATGSITTTTELDYEDVPSYILTIRARDAPGLTSSGSATVLVSVMNANEFKPVFTQPSYNVSVPEDVQLGFSFLKVTARDNDSGFYGVVTYSATPHSRFSIDSKTGHLSVKAGLDYEAETAHVMAVRAEDSGGLSANATVVIRVTPVNEHPPVFGRFSPVFSVPENSPPGTSVTRLAAGDLDKGSDGNVTYTLSGGLGVFQIGRTTGVVSSTTLMDREAVQSYSLVVVAADGGIRPGRKSASATVSIEVTDVNDNAPVCSSSEYLVHVKENAAAGASLARISCRDFDLDPRNLSNLVTYMESGGNGSSVFIISPNTGEVSVARGNLDRETASKYVLNITASDGGSPSLSTTIRLIVVIDDINDNSPIFSRSLYSVLVSESASVGHRILQLNATDSDSGPAGEVLFSIISGDASGRFLIDPASGVVTLASPLDRESVASYSLTVRSTDRGRPGRSADAVADITVVDENDSPPSCAPSAYPVTVVENSPVSTVVASLICSDTDSAHNAALNYSLVAGNVGAAFAINRGNGTVQVRTNLDAERINSYTLTANVTDGTFTTQCTVTVKVIDVNEFPPKFVHKGPLSINVSEAHTVGSVVYRVNASDPDVSNNPVSYAITGPATQSFFGIETKTGIIRLWESLDRETKPSHIIVVQASDGLFAGALKTQMTVNIQVIDANDNSPSCDSSFYYANVSEAAPVSVVPLVTINCTDADLLTPLLTYGFRSGNRDGNFKLSSSGHLTRTKILDYETTASYSLNIVVSDGGSPNLTAEVGVRIQVLPVNEYPPMFNPTTVGYRASVSEGAPPGTSVAHVSATDKDRGSDHGRVSFSISDGDSMGQFSIDPQSGIIHTIRAIDRETISNYILTVKASDRSPASASRRQVNTTVSIAVLDENDNYPEFTPKVYLVSVAETAPRWTSVLRLTAVDDDSGAAASLVYSIVSGNTAGIFSLSNATLFVAGPLNHTRASRFRLEVNVSDRGHPALSSRGFVTVNVLPRNLHPPAFTTRYAAITLSETTPVGSIIYVANATDGDAGKYGKLKYYLSSGNLPDNRTFFLDEDSGEIIVRTQLDYDAPPTRYNLTVLVEDGGGNDNNTFRDTMTLTVHLLNANDHEPIFDKNTYRFAIDENVYQVAVGSVHATDGDSGPFGNISYRVVSGDGASHFRVDRWGGRVSARDAVDYEQKAFHSLVLEAADQGVPPKSSRCLVLIRVRDANDNSPEFNPASFTRRVLENVTTGHSVGAAIATDRDSSANGNNVLTYFLTSTQHFLIDSASGLITTRGHLDRELRERYSLIILAKDQGSPQRTGTCTLTVVLEDVNDHHPVIYSRYSTVISESTSVQSNVFTFSATDQDKGENGRVSYSITAGNTGSDFALDQHSGLLRTRRKLDRERTSAYYLSIVVSDNGRPPKSSDVRATVLIRDENDNKPVFAQSSFTFRFPENFPPGSKVGEIVATDGDIGINAAISFRIVSVINGPDDFIFRGGSKNIHTRRVLDRESSDFYKFLCEARDAGAPALSSSVNVSVVVTDVNDNAPAFGQPSYVAFVRENAAPGTVVVKFEVTDRDSGQNAQTNLTVLDSVGDGPKAARYFEASSSTATLVLARSVNRESVSHFNFTMLVTDNGVPPLGSRASVYIAVVDENDNEPDFDPTFYNGEVAYNAKCESSIVDVRATDLDTGENAAISYYLIQSKYSYLFSVGKSSGTVSLQMAAGRNRKYVIGVKAHDNGSPAKTSWNNATVRVDTFVPSQVAISFHLSVSRGSFNAKKDQFLRLLSKLLQVKYPAGVFKLWCVEEGEAELLSRNRRQLLSVSTSSPISVNIYCLTSNATDSSSSLHAGKTFCSKDEALSFVTVDDTGAPSAAVQGPAWDYFGIQKIVPYVDVQTPWIESTKGQMIVVIVVLSLLLVITLTICTICCCKKRNKRPITPLKSTVEERRDQPADEGVNYEKKQLSPAVSKLPDSPSPLFRGGNGVDFRERLLNRAFDGRAVDPVTGKLYEYNTRTNERHWVTTPDGRAVGVNSDYT